MTCQSPTHGEFLMTMHTRQKPGTVSSTLARDRLGIAAVLAFILAGVAPLTVAAGLIPAAYATTGLTGIPAAFLGIAVLLAVFAVGYMAMSRHIINAGAFYGFVSQGLGRAGGVAAALMALWAYSCLQIALYGMFGPVLAAQASAHLGLHAPWWVWALGAWAVVAVLGLLRVEITGRVLGLLTAVEIVVILALSISGLAHPAGGHLSFATLSPHALTSGGAGTLGVLAVIAVLGFSGFEQGPVLAEEAIHPRRTIPVTTFTALCLIGVVYGGSAWAMAAHAGENHVVAAAGAQGPALLFGLGTGALNQAGQWLFLTSLSAACMSFHNSVLRYAYSLGREGVLPGWLGRTAGNSIPRAASMTQSGTGLVAIAAFAVFRWPPQTGLFFGGGTTGGLGVLFLLALTCAAVIMFFRKDPRGEAVWSRLIAPAFAGVVLVILAVLAVQHYSTLLGVQPGALAAWALPASYAVLFAAGLIWGMYLRAWRPDLYQTIGLGVYAPAAYPVSRHGPA
jgi:amino acid transporter